MYQPEVIQELAGRLGWREPVEEEYQNILDAANKTSRSGRYFGAFHAVVTVANMKDVVNPQPHLANDAFNTFLADYQKDCIGSVLDAVFSKGEIIEQQMVYERDDERPQLLPNTGQFVGFEIQVANRTNIAVRLNAISLFFNGNATFNIYLYNHLQKSPIATIPVITVADNEVIVPLSDIILGAITKTNKSRTFFIGYFQDDLQAQGVQAYDFPRLKRIASCYSADGFEAPVADGDFDRYNPGRTGRTYGINIEMSGCRDYTEVIRQHQQAFDQAIGLQMAARVTEFIINGLRSNATQRISNEAAQRLYNDLNLDMSTPELPYSSGLKNQLRREIIRLYNNFFPKGRITAHTAPVCSIRNPHR